MSNKENRYTFLSRAAVVLRNDPQRRPNLLRVDIDGKKCEALVNCNYDPEKCALEKTKGPGGICWAQFTLNKKNHQQTAVFCGSVPGIKVALAEYGGIKKIPLVDAIEISSRRRGPTFTLEVHH